MKQLIAPLLAALALTACATPQPTLYQAAAGPRSVGYSEYRIEPGRYRITFRGGPGAPPNQVADYALLRAADLAIADGYDWFRVSERFMAGEPDRSPRVSLGFGGGNYGWHSGASVGLGTSFSTGGGPSIASTLEVVMGKGPKPAGADVYDARGVRSSMGQRI
jgi:hypothetical protein